MITLTYLLKMCDSTIQKSVQAHWNSHLQDLSIGKTILAFPAVHVTHHFGRWIFTSQSRFIFKWVEILREKILKLSQTSFLGGEGVIFNLLSDATDCLPSTFMHRLSSRLVCLLIKVLYLNLGTGWLCLITLLSHSSGKRAFVRKWKIWGNIRKFHTQSFLLWVAMIYDLTYITF